MENLRAFLEATRAALGADAVVEARAEVEARAAETGHVQQSPSAFVYPSSTEQVQQVVRLANTHGVQLFPSSRGHNWGYGGNNPVVGAAVVLGLERMNRVLELNEELAFAVIEPGVTYEQFHAHLAAAGHRLWADTTDGPPGGSVLGNALDRGIGETPYGDHFANLCGLEVVLPTGEVVHTGGSSPTAPLKTWHTHKWGIGPYLEGAFTQSNFGIVTRAGIWLMPRPQKRLSYILELDGDEHLAAAIDAFRRLALQGVVSSKLHLISDFVSLTILSQRIDEDIVEPGALTEQTMARLRRRHGFGRWSGGAGLYGSPEQVALQKRLLKRELGRFGRILFFSDRTVSWLERLLKAARRAPWLRRVVEGVSRRSLTMIAAIPYLHRILQGEPTTYFMNHCYFRMPEPRPNEDARPATDGVGLTWFAPILPFVGREVQPFLDEARRRFEAKGFDFYQAMLMLNPRSVVCLMGILFRKQDADEAKRAAELYEELLTWIAERGYQQYRAGLAAWPRVFENAPEWAQLLERVHASLDPKNVLAPGKYGIGRP